jgi:hypothetical protein
MSNYKFSQVAAAVLFVLIIILGYTFFILTRSLTKAPNFSDRIIPTVNPTPTPSQTQPPSYHKPSLIKITSSTSSGITTKGVIREASLGQPPGGKKITYSFYPHLSFQLATDSNNIPEASSGYYLWGLDDWEWLGECVEIRGELLNNADNRLKRRLLKILQIRLLSLSDCNPYPKRIKTSNGKTEKFRGMLDYKSQPITTDGLFGYSLFPDESSDGIPLIPANNNIWRQLEEKITYRQPIVIEGEGVIKQSHLGNQYILLTNISSIRPYGDSIPVSVTSVLPLPENGWKVEEFKIGSKLIWLRLPLEWPAFEKVSTGKFALSPYSEIIFTLELISPQELPEKQKLKEDSRLEIYGWENLYYESPSLDMAEYFLKIPSENVYLGLRVENKRGSKLKKKWLEWLARIAANTVLPRQGNILRENQPLP